MYFNLLYCVRVFEHELGKNGLYSFAIFTFISISIWCRTYISRCTKIFLYVPYAIADKYKYIVQDSMSISLKFFHNFLPLVLFFLLHFAQYPFVHLKYYLSFFLVGKMWKPNLVHIAFTNSCYSKSENILFGVFFVIRMNECVRGNNDELCVLAKGNVNKKRKYLTWVYL